jgi:hypothetical protein
MKFINLDLLGLAFVRWSIRHFLLSDNKWPSVIYSMAQPYRPWGLRMTKLIFADGKRRFKHGRIAAGRR